MSAEDAERHAATVLAERSFDPAATGPGRDHDLVGTGIGAALSSFCFFASGALVPVLPFLIGLDGRVALGVATGLVALALMFTGAVVGLMSGGPPLRRAGRQLAIGLGAAGVTYALGVLFGAAVG